MKGNNIGYCGVLLVIFFFSISNLSFAKKNDNEKFDILFHKNHSVTKPNFTSDHVTDMITSQYKNNSIYSLVDEIIWKLPTTKERISKMEFLYTVIKDNNDTLNTYKMYEFFIHYVDLLDIYNGEGNFYFIPEYIRIPGCIRQLLWQFDYLCFDNGEYILSSYSSVFYPNTQFYLPRGDCNSPKKYESYWTVTKRKDYTYRDIESSDFKSKIDSISFELAPPNGDKCYIALNNKYLAKDPDSQYIRYVDHRGLADKWAIKGYISNNKK